MIFYRSDRLRRPYCTTMTVAMVLGSVISDNTVSARADTPEQTKHAIQIVCNRAATSFDNRDLLGFMAMYSPNFTERSIPGRITDFRQTQAGIANAFANNHYSATVHYTISRVVPQGSRAKVVLRWHYVSHYTSGIAAQAYTIVRDYEEQSVWEKSTGGWHEVTSDITHDVLDFQR